MRGLKAFARTIGRTLAATVAAAILAMVLRYHPQIPPMVELAAKLAVAAGSAGLLLWALAPWWRSLDEAVREANKSAFFWGGQFGILFAFLLGMIEMTSTPFQRPRVPEWMLGVIIALVCQWVGYVIFHLIWWLRRGGWGAGK
ncbi:hypothetical protein ASD89_09275 [Caulobacter sp. Root656]|nr:hypothetical protein ASD89_09275 [Caulobacter sp. Root656]